MQPPSNILLKEDCDRATSEAGSSLLVPVSSWQDLTLPGSRRNGITTLWQSHVESLASLHVKPSKSSDGHRVQPSTVYHSWQVHGDAWRHAAHCKLQASTL